MILEDIKANFIKKFPNADVKEISSHGRLEIIGNHTDHNHGLCLVGAASLEIRGYIAKNNNNLIEIDSYGFDPFTLDINDVELKENQKGTSIALVKGVLKGFLDRGFKVGGFNLACYSTIFNGAGVSSSAAFEALICKALSYFYNNDEISAMDMAKISQFSEREYFGKPCGLLDQIGAVNGGVSYIDFKDINNPKVEPINFNLPLEILLVNTKGSHAHLTPYYASITEDMKEVAKCFNQEFLRDVKPLDFITKVDELNVSNRAKNRARHYFEENRRVTSAFLSIKNNDVDGFLNMIKLTQDSSQHLLENTQVPNEYAGSPQEAVDRANKIIKHGAARIMGGGFAGSIICFVDPEEVISVTEYLASFYGKDSIVNIKIPDVGPMIK